MNFCNPEDVRPWFGSKETLPEECGSFAVPVYLHTKGATKNPTCSTAKKKECAGVLQFITTKSMTSYDADMDRVEEALVRAGFASSAKLDSSTQDSSTKDAATEMIEKQRSAAIDTSTDAASSKQKQQKRYKRKLEHIAEIDTSTEATGSKKERRETQRSNYSSYNCVALCFGLTKQEAMKRIEVLRKLKKPVKKSTFNSVLRELGITCWPHIRKIITSASTSTHPETMINFRAPEIMQNTNRWGKPVQEQLTSSHSFKMAYPDRASANVAPNMASSSLVKPSVHEMNTTWDEPVQEQLTSSGRSNMPYVVGAPANETPNLASSNETLIIPTAPEVPTGLGPTENAHWIHNTNEKHLERDFDFPENQNDYVQLPGQGHTEDQVMASLVGAPVDGTSYLASSFETPNPTRDEMMVRELLSPERIFTCKTDQGGKDPAGEIHNQDEVNDAFNYDEFFSNVFNF